MPVCVCYFRSRGQTDAEKGQERLRGNLDLAGSERAQLERTRQTLSEQVYITNIV